MNTIAHPLQDGSGKKGRILRVKHGYNPNSSSLGSEFFAVFVVPASLFAVTIGFGAVSGMIFSAFMRTNTDGEHTEEESESKEPGLSETRNTDSSKDSTLE